MKKNLKKWSDFFKQPLRPEYEDRVLRAADEELKKLQETSTESTSLTSAFSFSRWAFISSLVLSSLALVMFFKLKKKKSRLGAPYADIPTLDTELFEDLEFFEDLDVIEALDESGEGLEL